MEEFSPYPHKKPKKNKKQKNHRTKEEENKKGHDDLLSQHNDTRVVGIPKLCSN
jgi:hypothetical protein